MADFEAKIPAAAAIIEKAISLHSPKHIFVCLSGGHDSMSMAHFAASVLGGRMTGVVHVNTGFGIEATRVYVREQCAHYGWRLLEYKATENVQADGTPDPMIYEDIVTKYGFPGPSQHRVMYTQLKERQLMRLARDYGATSAEPIMLCSGIRREESTVRMGRAEEIHQFKGLLWVNPFIDMTGIDCNEYMAHHAIKRNLVKDTLHMSGECLCGAFAHPGELKEIELWYPKTAAEIRRIEAKVRAAGFPWGWEEGPPKWWGERKKAAKYGQQDAFEAEAQEQIQYLCVGCNKRAEEAA